MHSKYQHNVYIIRTGIVVWRSGTSMRSFQAHRINERRRRCCCRWRRTKRDHPTEVKTHIARARRRVHTALSTTLSPSNEWSGRSVAVQTSCDKHTIRSRRKTQNLCPQKTPPPHKPWKSVVARFPSKNQIQKAPAVHRQTHTFSDRRAVTQTHTQTRFEELCVWVLCIRSYLVRKYLFCQRHVFFLGLSSSQRQQFEQQQFKHGTTTTRQRRRRRIGPSATSAPARYIKHKYIQSGGVKWVSDWVREIECKWFGGWGKTKQKNAPKMAWDTTKNGNVSVGFLARHTAKSRYNYDEESGKSNAEINLPRAVDVNVISDRVLGVSFVPWIRIVDINNVRDFFFAV